MKHFKCKLFKRGHHGMDMERKWKHGPGVNGCDSFGPCGPCGPREGSCGPCGPREGSSGPDCGPGKEHRERKCKRDRGHHGHHGRHGMHHGHHGHGHHGHGPRCGGHGPHHGGHGLRHGGHGPHHGGHGPHHLGDGPHHGGYGPHHGGHGKRGCGPCSGHDHEGLRRRFNNWSKEELLMVLINSIERASPKVTEITEKSRPEAMDQTCDRGKEGDNEKNAEKEKTMQTPAETSDSERPQSE